MNSVTAAPAVFLLPGKAKHAILIYNQQQSKNTSLPENGAGKDPMERQYTRLDSVRAVLDEIINGIADPEQRRGAYVHLYGTGLLAATLALKRGFDRETAELAEISGMLHDLLCYTDPKEDTDGHAEKCAGYAEANVFPRLSCFTEEEKQQVLGAVRRHSDKHRTGSPFDELLKDADCAHHALRNPMEDLFFDIPRVRRVVDELCGTEADDGNLPEDMWL